MTNLNDSNLPEDMNGTGQAPSLEPAAQAAADTTAAAAPAEQTADETPSGTLYADAFETMHLSPSLQRGVAELGFEYMTPIQEQAIPLLLTGKDVIGQAQTGTGKTAAFGIPLLQKIDPDRKELQAVVLCPTRELAMQAAEDLKDLAKYMHGVRILPVYGGQDITRQIKGLKGCQIVVGTPGRVMDHMRRHTIKMDTVSLVILDEADEMLDMGFREDMEVILGDITHEHQTCLFSATMPQPILDLAAAYQKSPEMIRVTPEELTINLVTQYYYPVRREYKMQALLRLLIFYRYRRSIIFCNTKAMVDDLSAFLRKEGLAAEGLHGNLSQNQRDSVMGRFRGGSLEILIATDIAARGIDVDRVEAVFNYDLPQEVEYYVHRIGRTGRAGNEGTSHTLCQPSEFRRLHMIERICSTQMEERKIPEAKDILEFTTMAALSKATTEIAGGSCGKFVPYVNNFCQETGIAPEMLAAAFLKMNIGSIPKDLPFAPETEKERRSRRRSGDRYGDDRGRRSERRGDDRYGNRSERRDDRFGRRGDRDDDRFGKRDERSGNRRDERSGNRSERRDDRFGRRKDQGDELYGSRKNRHEQPGSQHVSKRYFGWSSFVPEEEIAESFDRPRRKKHDHKNKDRH